VRWRDSLSLLAEPRSRIALDLQSGGTTDEEEGRGEVTGTSSIRALTHLAAFPKPAAELFPRIHGNFIFCLLFFFAFFDETIACDGCAINSMNARETRARETYEREHDIYFFKDLRFRKFPSGKI